MVVESAMARSSLPLPKSPATRADGENSRGIVAMRLNSPGPSFWNTVSPWPIAGIRITLIGHDQVNDGHRQTGRPPSPRGSYPHREPARWRNRHSHRPRISPHVPVE